MDKNEGGPVPAGGADFGAQLRMKLAAPKDGEDDEDDPFADEEDDPFADVFDDFEDAGTSARRVLGPS